MTRTKTEGFTLLVWILPALLVLGGALVVRAYFRSTAGAVAAAAPAEPAPATPDDPDLEQWLQRARDLSGSSGPGPGNGGAST